MTAVVLPENFSYVGATLLSTSFLLAGQSIIAGRYRKRAGIEYPQLYAEQAQVAASRDALLFNCAQRAHQNTLEYIPIILVTTTLAGLRYPIFAASACALWSLSRISYTRGYITGEPRKRGGLVHLTGSLGAIGLILTSIYTIGSSIISGI